MVYKPKSLKCLVERNDTNIKSVTTQYTSSFEKIGGGISCEEGIIGDHLTIGIIEFNKKYMLNTHTTIYSEDPSNLTTFVIEYPIECFIDIHKPLLKSTTCLTRKGADTKTLCYDKYEDEPELLEVIKFFKEICIGNIKIESGSHGGTFVMKNGKKRYLKTHNSIRGGAMSEIIQNTIDMVYEKLVKYVLNSVHVKNSLPVEASMIFDTQNYFGLRVPVIVLIYDIEEANKRAVFYLNLEHINMACQYYEQLERDIRPLDKQQKRCWEEFQQHRDNHTRVVLAIAT